MQYCKKAFSLAEALAVAAVLSLTLASFSEATWTVDLTGLTTDVTAVGTAILAVAVVIFGFRTVRRMVGR
ncbi:MAG: hypothetical protein EPN22_17470 [Nitrospirae bacterium]|nr:MAG: hypothetical protein EPN22_17470 [Nitrospirota bacterium]